MLFVGAHAQAGTPDGILSHTISEVAWYEATVNGAPVRESGIIAGIAGHRPAQRSYLLASIASSRALRGG